MTSQSPSPAVASSLFGGLARQPADALLAIIGMHRADPRSDKIDLGVGVYRDPAGETPVMRAVKDAEARLVAEQPSKSYLGAEGDARFTELLAQVALGAPLANDPGVTGIQTPGGTGALRLAGELIARSGTAPTIWIGTPSWPNHLPIFRGAGLEVRSHAYFDAARSELDFDACVTAVRAMPRGDVVLLHGCCHNPTGTAFTDAQWAELTALVAERGVVPLIDLAYQGLGVGLEADAAGARAMVAAVPEAVVAYSCDKNFGLYRERVGALWVRSADAVGAVRDNLLALSRSLWSMPPDHGAACVRLILEDAALADDWRAELADMRTRINRLRALLGAAHPALAPIATQQGLFALLPIDRAATIALRETHGIYMAESGRINVAGLREDLVERLVSALAPYLPRG